MRKNKQTMDRRWLDHLPPWLALLTLAASGLFDLKEVALMGLPLALAAGIAWQRWNLARWRRTMEMGALGITLLMVVAHVGLLYLLACLIFLLSGIRLALPRTLPQRRQILLMGFLVFLMAAMSQPSLDFALWTLLWTGGAAVCLADQTWAIPGSRPPLRPLGKWVLGIFLVAAVCFLGLPRIQAGHPLPAWGIRGFGSGIGLAESMDLADRGPLHPPNSPVLRIVPKAPLTPSMRLRMAQRLALLKGFSLEALEGFRWDTDPSTPQRRDAGSDFLPDSEPSGSDLEVQILPTSGGLIPLPYGTLTLRAARGWLLGPRPGGGFGWSVPPSHGVSMDLTVGRDQQEDEELSADRKVFLCQTSGGTECTLQWSRKVAPEDLPAPELAARLSAELQSYRYTLSNPSGRASNPLQDFLERTRAGHCEYFASALACALRSRGIPARIAVGYRLGPWIAEGGYWLVTQNEAHSWVEFYDAAAHGWRIADPTPAAPGTGSASLITRFRHLQDALLFRWDRYILRFSGKDQAAGLAWIQRRMGAVMPIPGHGPLPSVACAAAVGILGLGVWLGIRPRIMRGNPGGVRELAPLLRRTRRICPPGPGETARAWLMRLATLAPDHRKLLMELAEALDLTVYGSGSAQNLRNLARKASWNFTARFRAPMRNRGSR